MIASMSSTSDALDGLLLMQAGFTSMNPSEETPEEFVSIIRVQDLGKNSMFFWTEIKCRTKECERLLSSGEVKLVHRWVRMLGTRLRTQQLKTFSPEELSENENAVWSEQEIKYPGRWILEVSTSDGEILCLEKLCKFKLGVR